MKIVELYINEHELYCAVDLAWGYLDSQISRRDVLVGPYDLDQVITAVVPLPKQFFDGVLSKTFVRQAGRALYDQIRLALNEAYLNHRDVTIALGALDSQIDGCASYSPYAELWLSVRLLVVRK